MIDELHFRRLCRSNTGGLESREFIDALDRNPDTDMIPITLIGTETKLIPRPDVEQYAQWAKQELKPEEELLKQIQQNMKYWVILNRDKMITRLTKALENYHPGHNGVTVVWEICAPDKIDFDVVQNYLKRYN